MFADDRKVSPNVRVNPATVQKLPLTSHLQGFTEMIASSYFEHYMGNDSRKAWKAASSQ
jgi:hypothetical protein